MARSMPATAPKTHHMTGRLRLRGIETRHPSLRLGDYRTTVVETIGLSAASLRVNFRRIGDAGAFDSRHGSGNHDGSE